MGAFEKGPYLQVAVLCEQIVKGETGQLTLVNLLDHVANAITGPDVPDEMPPFTVTAKALILLKAGSARGRFAIKLQPEDPSGERRSAVEIPVQFGGGDPNAAAAVVVDPLNIEVQQEGLHWIDVIFASPGRGGEELLLTRIPLTVEYRPQKTQVSG